MKFLLLILLLIAGTAYAGGGDDHTHAPTGVSEDAAPSTGAGFKGSTLKIVSYPGNLEVYVKYPAPHLNEPVTGRLFFAEYASNHPVDPTGIQLSFPGALGAKVTKQPVKISDGVYEFIAVFVRDTNHTALLRYIYGDQEQLASLSPFYAGKSAERLLSAETISGVNVDDGFSFSSWMLLPILVGVILVAYLLAKRKSAKSTVTSSPIVTTIEKHTEI